MKKKALKHMKELDGGKFIILEILIKITFFDFQAKSPSY